LPRSSQTHTWGATGATGNFAATVGTWKPRLGLLRCNPAKINILLPLRISIRDAFVRVADPEPQQILGNTLLPEPRHAVQAEGMESANPPASLMNTNPELLPAVCARRASANEE
jgi:hypothetical protein